MYSIQIQWDSGFVRATLSVGEAFQPRFAYEGRGWKAALTGISTRNLNKIRLNVYDKVIEELMKQLDTEDLC